MSRVKFVAVLVTLGLAAILVPVAVVLAQGGGGTVTIMDSDATDYSGTLSDMAMIALSDVPPLADGWVYEGWFVSDDGSRKESTGTFVPDADGNVNQTAWLPGSAGTVEVRSRPDWGWYLTDSNGMTVYNFIVDTPGSGTSNCSGSCAESWPPLIIAEGQPTAGMGVNPRMLGTITRDDGSTQVTYNGWPLYYFKFDFAPGDTAGRYGTWWTLSPMGDMIEETALFLILNEQNDSGQSGGAMLTAKDGGTEVMLQLSAGAMETTAVHVHSGRCGAGLGGVVHSLTSFAGGSGTLITMLDGVSIDSLMNGDFAINSHNSDDASIYTACSDIPSLADSMTVALDEQNDSGQSGWATLTARGDDTEVVLSISAGNMETTAVHIHTGQCGADLGGVAHGLTSFVGGSGVSATLLSGVSLSELASGTFAINSHNSSDASVYTTCGSISVSVAGAVVPTGENLFAAFDKFVVTVEPVDDPDPEPSGDVPFIGQLDSGALAHIRHLAYSWQGNPSYLSGVHQGEPKGITVGLREQVWVAVVHTGLSADSTTLAGISRHAEHVVNAIEGTGDKGGSKYGDIDGNGTAEDFGDGIGLLNYAADAKTHAQLAMSVAPGDKTVQKYGQMVVDAADRVTLWATQARDLALLAAGSDRLTSATLFSGNSRSAMENAWSGAVDAYTSSQNMGMYTVAPVPTPVEICDNNVDDDGDGMVDTDDSDCPKPPKTGDPIVPNAAFAALLLGAVLLASGAYIWRRSRQVA